MRVRRGFLNWGFFLICLGAIPLAVQTGVLDRETASGLLRLWPVLLIGAGIGLILRFTQFELIGGVIVGATLGVLAGSVLVGGISAATVGCAGGAVGGTETRREGTFSGAQGRVEMNLSCAQVEVSRTPGQGWNAMVTSASTPVAESDDASVVLRSGGGNSFPLGRAAERWLVSLPADPTLSANVTVNAATGRVALGGGPLSDLSASFNAADVDLDLSGTQASPVTLNGTFNASSATLRLPDGDLIGDLDVNAGSVTICVAAETGLSIGYEGTLSSNNFGDVGMTANGERWQTPGFDTAANQVRLEIDANVSSTTVNRSGGCE
jgi:hypothetical protein